MPCTSVIYLERIEQFHISFSGHNVPSIVSNSVIIFKTSTVRLEIKIEDNSSEQYEAHKKRGTFRIAANSWQVRTEQQLYGKSNDSKSSITIYVDWLNSYLLCVGYDKFSSVLQQAK